MRVLVTGGTGVLGREVVRRLRDRGAEVRVLVRGADRSGPGYVRGDLETGEGLAEAVAGVDVIVHCASATDYRRPERDVAQAKRLLSAVGDARPHVIYISIVGVDRVRFGYYRAKLATEQLIAESGLPWTVLRTTQFHDLVLLALMLLTKGPVAVVPRGFRAQPVDTGEVAERLADLAFGEPAGRAADLGGPEVADLGKFTRDFLAATGKRRLLVRLPMLGRAAADFRAGGHLLGDDGESGRRTFADYVRSRLREQGKLQLPYRLSGRR
jgi:uncharacterized protein YbjT (DUF2867 family)